MIIEAMNKPFDGVTPLPHLGVIRVHGDDTANFLQGQLTQDFLLLRSDEARLAAYCTAKGRMVASFVAIKRSPAEVWLVCSKDLLAQTMRRLSMFVLRAKVRVEDASETFLLRGLLGNAVPGAAAPWSRSDYDAATVVHLYPGADVPRALWIAPVGTDPPRLPLLDPMLWPHYEVLSGVATLGAASVEAYVPQMLNYESVGGVNFKKGCYPGQEVVARSQFRGTLKRRAFLVSSPVAMVAGDELFDPSEADQPCASVVQVAAAPGGGYDALVSGRVSAMQLPQLHLRAADGPVVYPRPVPYALLDDI